MTSIEILLAFIAWQLFMIWVYVRWIYLKVQYGKLFDPQAPVNAYGEGLADAIQNSIERGQRGISTYQ
jgi:hypothetical protein